MKNIRTLFVAVLALVFANSVWAAYTISVTTSPTVDTTAGASGQSSFQVFFSGGGQFSYVSRNLWAVDEFNNPLTTGVDSPFSSLTIDPSSTLLLGSGRTYTSGTTYTLVVNWTVDQYWVSGGQYGIYFNLFVNQPNAVRANAGATDIINISATPVPEPNQVLGASMLFGVGAIAFTGRRWLKAKAVK